MKHSLQTLSKAHHFLNPIRVYQWPRHVAQNRSRHWSTHKQANIQMNVTHPHKAAAHVGISYREVGFGDGFLEDEVNDTLEPLFCVYGELRHLLHQLLEHLWRELAKDAAYTAEQLLRFRSF